MPKARIRSEEFYDLLQKIIPGLPDKNNVATVNIKLRPNAWVVIHIEEYTDTLGWIDETTTNKFYLTPVEETND